ncbi:transcriptional regulator, TetR family [Streptoalloteichus tenebrarius]|uniref:Transcriptional regulator, TetR family n=1 Tax=Streptoalloteichus tenebrarius (strain ATCC 17920 / DSM 40477 / JCM 4838 / CBS 697.72 / NBRC 16177 / NCIMB 11028 / NRRL B-12390 / A12253. 1 / ISP 5477) TaxID=1933 RepID=A0ABT1HM24_STRSD|nr:TetR family transcriptional regulator [Streptoalloteichus tenebrarius]MCP2256543.1 transcriptional regulator, TetR family [Streptoalloteichus tenebrarius]BFF04898.1 TetR family transcriptional regulator [Streptoalloteichus tenebrarius]
MAHDVTTDGRRLKGERRRQELIDATVRVVARQGVSGVSHRTVAREAGLPATAAAYYFQGIDDLLTAALSTCMDEDADRLRVIAANADGTEAGLRALAELMGEIVTPHPSRLLAEYELYLLAARSPALREPTRRWRDALAAFARCYVDDPVRVQVFVGAFDGLLLQALLTDEPPTVDEFEAMLRDLLAPNADTR